MVMKSDHRHPGPAVQESVLCGASCTTGITLVKLTLRVTCFGSSLGDKLVSLSKFIF